MVMVGVQTSNNIMAKVQRLLIGGLLSFNSQHYLVIHSNQGIIGQPVIRKNGI